jgi:hypothetical protein
VLSSDQNSFSGTPTPEPCNYLLNVNDLNNGDPHDTPQLMHYTENDTSSQLLC